MEHKEKQTGLKIGSRDYGKALCGKGNKAGLAIKLAFSLLFAFMTMLSSLIVFDGTVFARLDKTYFRPMSFGALGVFIAALIASYCIICLLEVVFANLEEKCNRGAHALNEFIFGFLPLFYCSVGCRIIYPISRAEFIRIRLIPFIRFKGRCR